ncbi:MAG: mechanosensitive ion channel family protein [Prosthecochloris sp.]|uniref:mechanosensitive ion channel family protein n=1 Tax=unclassified Prosthecochloris TaxID=2632826 RepID=UPI000DF7A80D|nr:MULTISPECIES: mechanosensitive ion channel family protein [unclassified Prosthecochloris]MCW8797658.1 mechanosensitive ion channel family protein [Prosthecochloris sp.]RDD30294.1 mechanosensitive ion channel protein MscS [Prosthecochloris sp. ZM]
MESLSQSLISRLKDYFNAEKMGLVLGEILIETLIAVSILSVFYLFWRIIKWIVGRRLEERFDKTSAAFAEAVIKFTIFAIAIISALGAAGVKTDALLGSLGVLGLTLGFALRDTLSNIVSGILIFLDRPFTINDLVEIDGKYGRIDRITLRTTRVVTNDGKMLAVPNAEIMNKTVTSYTNFPHLRIDVGVTIAVTENIDLARKLLLKLVNDDPDFMQQPLPVVVVTELNDYNVVLELEAWLQDERRHIEKRCEIREKIFRTFTKEGIDMPYETIRIVPRNECVSLADDGKNSMT